MGFKYIFIAFLILLVACSPAALQAVPTAQRESVASTETSTPVSNVTDLCKNVNCSEGQTCKNGKCACETGKLCGKACIDKNACCTDKDCPSGKCESNACTVAKDCRYGEELKNGECECAKGYNLCREQGKCIPSNSCCVHSQCKSFERCVESNWRTSFCIKIDEKKLCKILADNNRTEVFDIKTDEFRVGAQYWLSNGSVRFNFNNENFTLAENKTQSYVNGTMNESVLLFQEGVKITGGFCKEDDET